MNVTSDFVVTGVTRICERWSDDAAEFVVQVHCEVVKMGDPGGEAFGAIVISPKQLERELGNDPGLEFGRGYILMLDYDERLVVTELQRLLDRSNSRSWEDLVSFVGRYFDWID